MAIQHPDISLLLTIAAFRWRSLVPVQLELMMARTIPVEWALAVPGASEKHDKLIDYPRAIGIDDEGAAHHAVGWPGRNVLPHTTPWHLMRFLTRKAAVLLIFG